MNEELLREENDLLLRYIAALRKSLNLAGPPVRIGKSFTEWGVREDDEYIQKWDTESDARLFVEEGETVVTRTVTTIYSPWVEAPMRDGDTE